MGCYRKDEVADPETFATALVVVFCDYSEAIVKRVSDPRTGLPGKQKWAPSIAEINQECKALDTREREVEAWRARNGERQALPPPAVDRVSVMERIRRRYPDIWGKT